MSPRALEVVRRSLRTAAVRLPELFAPGSRLVVAFSGGQDSTCLLHALAHSHRKLELLAVHVDHALRPESAEAAQRMVELARSIGAACEVRRVDVPTYRKRVRGWSVQQAARAARYQALAVVVNQYQANAVLVAHTGDDQAETLLLNLIRGTGFKGLAGMRLEEWLDPRRLGPPALDAWPAGPKLRLVRPLLRVPRSATLAYCMHLGLPHVEDPSNQSRAYTRNRVRLDLLPALEQLNPSIRTVLARTAELAADEVAALDALVAELHPALARDHTYRLRSFRAEPRALQRRLLRFGLESLVGGLVDVSDAPIEDALDLLQTGQPNHAYHLPYGVELCIGSESFTLRRDGQARQPEHQKTWEVDIPRV
jgi:tRNA(Ile)-lysidine synthetase-like protein